MQTNRVKSAPYLGTLLDENLYWYDHVDQTSVTLVKFCGFSVLWNISSYYGSPDLSAVPVSILENNME